MRYRTPTQLHASLYMEECFTAKKEKGISKAGRDAKTGKCVTAKEANRRKKQNSYIITLAGCALCSPVLIAQEAQLNSG